MQPRVPWIVTLFLVSLLTLHAQSTEPSATPSSAPSGPQNSIAQESNASTPAEAVPPSQGSARQDAENQVPGEKRKLRLRFGGFSVGAGYSRFSGPLYHPYGYPYGYSPLGFYPGEWVGASLWYPVWGPYPDYGPGSFAYNSGRGEVRLTADPKFAEVYIDGGYAGTADKLKSLWLDPGAYDLTVSSAGREPFHQRLYVLSGKSLKITAKLNPDESKGNP